MIDIGFEPRLDPPEYEYPVCPCCGQEPTRIYKTKNGEVVGCDLCLEEELL